MSLQYTNLSEVFPLYSHSGRSCSSWLETANENITMSTKSVKNNDFIIEQFEPLLPVYTETDSINQIPKKKISFFRKIKNFFKRYFCCIN